MSIIRAIKHRLGLSVTPANNFVLTAEADNGTMKLARESGQDIMTVDATGKVVFPQNGAIGANDTASAGTVIKCARATVTFDATGTAAITFIGGAFPTSVSSLVLTNSEIAVGGEGVLLGAFSVTTSGFSCRAIKVNPYGVYQGQLQLSYIAMGY